MAVKDIRPLKRVSNEQMLDIVRGELSLDYQHRIPEATKVGIERTLKALTQFNALRNEFVGALVNRIGLVIAKNTIWTNPLAVFKRGMLTYGDTIEEIYTGLLESRVYDPDRENMEQVLFATELPEVQANFHRVNRQEFYKFTVNESLLSRAFLDDGGLQQFITTLMSAPTTSDNWDEFLLTCSLFKEYGENGGYFNVNIPDVVNPASGEAEAKAALRKIRAVTELLKFPSTRYNAARMPVFANTDELVLFTTPEFRAALDVEALASAFHMERAEIQTRMITIPKERFVGVGVGVEAILTTDDFFVIADQKIETTSQVNPASLHTNYFLHHWSVISASRFAPAITFGTGPDSSYVEITNESDTVSTIVFTDVDGATVVAGNRGYVYQATANSFDSVDTDTDLGVVFEVTGANDKRTHITDAGVLHIGQNETAATLSVTATALVEDSAGNLPTATASFAVIGDSAPVWPNP